MKKCKIVNGFFSWFKRIDDRLGKLESFEALKIKPLKKCKIINGPFSWFMQVDKETIVFSGSHAAEYFKNHYEGLGYEVEFLDQRP